jgi:thiosulfate/3-mercaptopyruvate sulfurtransferase
MSTSILLAADQLNELIQRGDCVTVDCRFDFSDPDKARNDWLAAHIPGAVYADMDNDLAAPIEDHTGRHPLPDTGDFSKYLASIGWHTGKHLVAYDAGSGALAVRLWWLMRYLGKPAAVLDGGIEAWKQAGYELESGEPDVQASPVEMLVPEDDMALDTEQLVIHLDEVTVLDARSEERFTGEQEHLDSKAGHIPGSINRPYDSNLAGDVRFKSAAELRAEFEQLLGDRDLSHVVHSCGSGVTACHNLFAMVLAGLKPGRLYPGSWSEWIRDPSRPIETGPSRSA